jgi:O-antigen/teichoic acid export membrane protein
MTEANVTESPGPGGFDRIKRMLRLVRLRPFDQSTPEGRSAERHRRLAISAITAILSKGVSVAVMFVIVAVTSSPAYLGPERFGLWNTISSIFAMLSFADLGLGNGLMTALSEAHGRDDRNAAARHVSSAFFMLLGIAAVMGVVFAASYPFISWPRVVHAESPGTIAEAGASCAVFFAFFLLNMPLGVVFRIQGGYQEGFATNIWSLAGSLLTLLGVLLCRHANLGLPWLITVLMGAPVLVLACAGVWLFGWQRPWLRPSLSRFSFAGARAMFNVGILFLVLQLCVSMAFFADSLILAHVKNLGSVTQYTIPLRLFSIPSMICTLLFSSLWPAYGEALARGDVSWIKRTLVRSLWMTLLATAPASLILALLHRPLLHLWVGDVVQPTWLLISGLAIWTVMGALGNTLSMLLNGLRIVGFQVVVSLTMASANLALSISLARRIGVPGVIWGTVISYSVFVVVPYAVYIPILIRRLQGAALVGPEIARGE